jgi:four helix bundle protein
LSHRDTFGTIKIIHLSSRLPNTPEGRVVRTQITKAGTSIGTNYHEANRSRSRSDFKNKIKICESKASECQYWLEIIIEISWLKQEEIKLEFKESSELLALFISITSKCSK